MENPPEGMMEGCNSPLGRLVLADWVEEITGPLPAMDLRFGESGFSDNHDSGDGNGYGNGYGSSDGDGFGDGYDGDTEGGGHGYGEIDDKGDGYGDWEGDGSDYYYHNLDV